MRPKVTAAAGPAILERMPATRGTNRPRLVMLSRPQDFAAFQGRGARPGQTHHTPPVQGTAPPTTRVRPRLRPVAALGPRPYLRPLRATPRSLRSGVIVADLLLDQ